MCKFCEVARLCGRWRGERRCRPAPQAMQDIERLFREYHHPIVRYLTRQLNDADLAEELAQETFVRALRYGASRHEPIANERAWLFAVATNLIRDTMRRETRQRRHLSALREDARRAEMDNATAGADEPSAEALRHAAMSRTALRAIPERDRAALFMSQEGLNYHEIAAALGLSVQSVGTTLTRARKKVVQSFEALMRHQESGEAHVAS